MANRHPDMTDKWFVTQGVSLGSTIIMMYNVHMTNEAWMHAAQFIMDRYLQVPIVRDNPDWGIVEFLDGFKSHKACFQANKVRTDVNCCSFK